MKKEEFSYDKTMAEVETIVKRIESGECKIDELTDQIKKAAQLIELCRKKLQSIEDDVKEVISD